MMLENGAEKGAVSFFFSKRCGYYLTLKRPRDKHSGCRNVSECVLKGEVCDDSGQLVCRLLVFRVVCILCFARRWKNGGFLMKT